tara:strand:- start:270 stop:737 length:468 start_codon:yes stop_codon:yes gene_type:complete
MSEEKKKVVQKVYLQMSDPDVREALLSGIRIGMAYHIAAQKVGVRPGTVKDWLTAGRKDDAKPQYRDFLIRYEQAKAEAEGTMLERITKAAAQEGDVKAAQWYLERMYPERYGKQARLEVTGKGGEELIPKTMFQSAVARAAGLAERRRRQKKGD